MKMRKLPTWREMHMDTSPEIEAMQFKFYRETPAWRKLQMMASLHQMARTLAMSGLQRRHPQATEAELQCYFTELVLGSELAARIPKGLRSSIFHHGRHSAVEQALIEANREE